MVVPAPTPVLAYCLARQGERSVDCALHLSWEELRAFYDATGMPLRVEYEGGSMDVRAGQSVVAHPGEWVRYSSPEPGGAEYIAVCLPAFSPETLLRARRA